MGLLVKPTCIPEKLAGGKKTCPYRDIQFQ
jgi:hypothetical protein